MNASDLLITTGEGRVNSPGRGGRGTRTGATVTDYELGVRGYRQSTLNAKPTRQQGNTQSPTSLSIVGEGFFAVAESLNPSARIFFTRNGRFSWREVGKLGGSKTDPIYKLVNDQGLYVLRAQDIQIDPKTGAATLKQPPAADTLGAGMAMTRSNTRDGEFLEPAAKITPGRIKSILGETEELAGRSVETLTDAELTKLYNKRLDNSSDIAIVKFPAAANLVNSSYGPEVFAAPIGARQGILSDSLGGWFDRDVTDAPKILPRSLEFLDQKALLDQTVIENESANFVYRTLSNFLQDYNKSIDDLLGIIR
jgi:hypothetical protein